MSLGILLPLHIIKSESSLKAIEEQCIVITMIKWRKTQSWLLL